MGSVHEGFITMVSRIPENMKYFGMRTVLRLRRNPAKIRQMLERAGVKQAMNILDYGCGIGSYSIEAAKITGPSGSVTAVDINERMLLEVKKMAQAEGLPHIRLQRINEIQEVAGDEFDFIFLLDVLHFMKDPCQAIEFMQKKLSATGKLLVKFEHFSMNRIKEIAGNMTCAEKTMLDSQYWIFSR